VKILLIDGHLMSWNWYCFDFKVFKVRKASFVMTEFTSQYSFRVDFLLVLQFVDLQDSKSVLVQTNHKAFSHSGLCRNVLMILLVIVH